MASLVIDTGPIGGVDGDCDGDADGDCDGDGVCKSRVPNRMKHPPHLTQYDIIYLEHNIIKFKRELIVGLGRRVFSAIQCHFENKIMDVRKELLGKYKQE